MLEEARGSVSLLKIVEGRDRCMAALPDEVRAERGDMAAI